MLHVERPTPEVARVEFTGAWRKEEQLPDPSVVWREIQGGQPVHRLTFDIFHYEIGQAVLGASSIQKSRDVRMVEVCKNLTLRVKVTQNKLRVHSTLDQLHCNELVKLLIGSFRKIYCAHSSAPDLTHNLIGSDSIPADQKLFRMRKIPHRIFDNRRLDEIARVLRSLKKRFHFLP